MGIATSLRQGMELELEPWRKSTLMKVGAFKSGFPDIDLRGNIHVQVIHSGNASRRNCKDVRGEAMHGYYFISVWEEGRYFAMS